MNMKDMIQRITDLENKKTSLTESAIAECGIGEAPMPAAMPANPGQPVTMNINLTASGAEHVADLLDMMKNAGLGAAKPVSQDMMPMRMDMERLRGLVDEPAAEEAEAEEVEAEEGYANEPEEEYGDIEDVTIDGNDIHKSKKMFKAANAGDNAMAMEDIAKTLYAALAEKKAKPDFLDVDKDGDKKEPMKKALKDKGSKPKKGEVPPQFKK